MPATVAPGKTHIELNLPEGAPDRLDRLRVRLRQEAVDAGATAEEATARFGDGRDRGAFVATLLEWAERATDLEGELAGVAAERDQASADRDAALAARTEAERQIAEADQELRRRVDVASDVLQIFAEARDLGVSRSDLVECARLVRQAGIPPHRLVEALRESGAATLLQYADQLATAVAEANRAVGTLQEEIAARKAAVRQLAQRAGEIEAQAGERIAAANGRLRQIGAQIEAAQAVLAQLGLFCDFLRVQGRVEDLPPRMARVLAGVILLASAGAHGDELLRIPAGGKGQRLLEATIAVSEVPYVLAPASEYQRMQQAQAARQARAEQLAAVGPVEAAGEESERPPAG